MRLFRHKYLLEQNNCLVWARKAHFVGCGAAETNWLCQPHQKRPRRQLWTLLKQKTPIPPAPLSLPQRNTHNIITEIHLSKQRNAYDNIWEIQIGQDDKRHPFHWLHYHCHFIADTISRLLPRLHFEKSTKSRQRGSSSPFTNFSLVSLVSIFATNPKDEILV